MRIQLSDHFTYGRLLRFTFPSIIMMIFTSIYVMADGFFVSNFVGKTPFAAVNFIYPVLDILGTVGYMVGAGGSALISKTMGERSYQKANQLFSMFVYLSAAGGAVMAVLGIAFIRPIAMTLGADADLLENSVLYSRIILLSLPAFILQFEFQTFFVTAEKPKLGLYVTAIAGLTNLALDALFIVVFHWGIAGAAAATMLSQTAGGVIPLFYFGRENSSPLRLSKMKFDGRALLKACANGSSELMSSVSRSLVAILYNFQLIKYAGEDGIAAYGILMYVNMIFAAAFFGYASGTAPVAGFHYGAQNHQELRSLRKKSFVVIGCFSAGMFSLAQLLASPLSNIFAGYDPQLLAMTIHGFRIYSFSFLLSGIAVFVSSFFTALNNGLVSAVISFLRALLFETAAVLIFPIFWKLDGIWFSIIAAELLSAAVSLLLLSALKGKYRY